jgi:hypothetical protein
VYIEGGMEILSSQSSSSRWGQRFTKCSLDAWDVEFEERATGVFEPFCSFAFSELLRSHISDAVTAGQPVTTCCDCLRGPYS